MSRPAGEIRFGRERLFDPLPHTQILAGGRHASVVTCAGSGGSTWNGIALTRWTPDPVEDGQGWYLYLRDADSGMTWSAGHQPAGQSPEDYQAAFSPGAATIGRTDEGIRCRLRIGVTADTGVELRRCTLTNLGDGTRRIQLTAYLEAVLQPAAADAAHPAFSKLFVQTGFLPDFRALIARRRRRAPDESDLQMAHWMIADGDGASTTRPEFETDRMRFIGRGRSLASPAALSGDGAPGGTLGPVLDPVLALRTMLTLAPGQSRTVTFALCAAESREALTATLVQFQSDEAVLPALESAEHHAVAQLARYGLAPADFPRIQALLGPLIHGGLRPVPAHLADASLRTQVRQAFGLAPRRPVVLVGTGHDALPADEVLTTIRAHRYLKALGIDHDLLILRRDAEGIAALAQAAAGAGVRIRDTGAIPDREMECLRALADVVLPAVAPQRPVSEPPATLPSNHRPHDSGQGPAPEPASAEPLLFDNGLGGFSRDGREYRMRVDPARELWPPQPWTNVVANEDFGFIASESGAGNTWAVNSRENRITPWHNDPVTDPHGEALYLRDEASGVVWSPMPGPVPGGCGTLVSHGFGYTRYRQSCLGIAQETLQFVPRDLPVKITRITLHNDSGKARTLRLFAMHHLVLGVLPGETRREVVTEFEPESRTLLATNGLNGEFAGQVAFCGLVTPKGQARFSFTCSRLSFTGRNRNARNPRAVSLGEPLDGAAGAGLDPCLAVSATLELAPGQTVVCAVLLGEAEGRDNALALMRTFHDAPESMARIDGLLNEVQEFWNDTLGALRIDTPSPELDLMFNGWLGYQNLACRIWGRSAFYQSGGAFGFRDQLQDAAAFVHTRPDLTRQQILLHAAHQFVEGDVLHWWHPPTGKGIRTRFSDDLLWLPYVTAFYVSTTGDDGVLGEPARFVTARALRPGEDEAFLLPEDSGETGDVYEHCCRALDRSLTRGVHGLPLMGTGDWNDGMNRVGREGRGESVWLGFFLYHILGEFAPLCESRGDGRRAARYRAFRAELGEALNEAGWDGRWYRRAYYDDGAPIGSAASDECRIDAIAQAWAVICGAAPPERARSALDALEHHLVSEPDGIIRLLTPAFDRTEHDPGYIKGYVPGVRENGGQYTHGVLWAVKALLESGRCERGMRLLEMLTPIAHGDTPQAVERYRVEPYVIAADVYGEPPHVGRGGWTWYTGSAGWMYRVILESLLGFGIRGGDTLVLKPRIPPDWKEFSIRYRLPDGTTRYEISVTNLSGTEGEQRMEVCIDGEQTGSTQDGAAIVPLRPDGQMHRVEVTLLSP